LKHIEAGENKETIIMNEKIYDIIKKFLFEENNPTNRAKIVLELGSELLESSPTFNGSVVDMTTTEDEARGDINFMIRWNDNLYTLSEYMKLAAV
jgi:hypothetical protein